MQADLITTIPCQCTLGEGILWDPRSGAFLWTDIEGRTLHSYTLASGDHAVLALPDRLASFALTGDPDVLVAAFDRYLADLDRRTGRILRRQLTADFLMPGTRFNDGKVGAQGQFWVGTMVEDADAAGGPDAGTLYRLLPDGGLSPERRGISISNGLAWAPDGIHFFFADSPRQQIWRMRQGQQVWTIEREEPFATTTGSAYPDGATTSADGRYWSALWGGSEVRVFNADGTVAGAVRTPVSQPSCCAFGGPDLSVLAVTSARQGLSPEALAAEPDAGNVFVYQTDACGLPPVHCGFNSA